MVSLVRDVGNQKTEHCSGHHLVQEAIQHAQMRARVRGENVTSGLGAVHLARAAVELADAI